MKPVLTLECCCGTNRVLDYWEMLSVHESYRIHFFKKMPPKTYALILAGWNLSYCHGVQNALLLQESNCYFILRQRKELRGWRVNYKSILNVPEDILVIRKSGPVNWQLLCAVIYKGFMRGIFQTAPYFFCLVGCLVVLKGVSPYSLGRLRNHYVDQGELHLIELWRSQPHEHW